MTSTFTSVLKKIGTVLLDGSEIAAEVLGFPFIAQLIGAASPKVASALQTGVADLNTLAGFVSTAEAMFPAAAGQQTGSQKLAAVTPMVQQMLLSWAQSSLPGHNKVKDPTLLAKAAGEIAGGMADAMNAFGD